MAKAKSSKKKKVSTKKIPAKKVTAKKISKVKKTAKTVTKNKLKVVANAKKAAQKPSKKATKSKKSNQKPSAQLKATASGTKRMNWENLITPLDDRIIVELLGASDRTPGGLFIPESAQSVENSKGKVLVVGRGRRDKKGKVHAMGVKPGEMVLFPQFVGSKINIAGSEVLILRESDLLGTLS